MYYFATLSPIATFIYLVFLWGDTTSQLSTRLRKIREKRGLTQVELASLCCTSRSNIACWENGSRFPEYSANRRPLVTVEKSTKYAEQVHFIKILNTLRSPLWFWKRHNKFLSLLCLFCFYCFNFEYSSRNDFPCKVIR